MRRIRRDRLADRFGAYPQQVCRLALLAAEASLGNRPEDWNQKQSPARRTVGDPLARNGSARNLQLEPRRQSCFHETVALGTVAASPTKCIRKALVAQGWMRLARSLRCRRPPTPGGALARLSPMAQQMQYERVQAEPVPLGLHHPVTLCRPRCGASAQHWLGDRHSPSVEPAVVRVGFSVMAAGRRVMLLAVCSGRTGASSYEPVTFGGRFPNGALGQSGVRPWPMG